MKLPSLLLATLAFPASVAFAQTPTAPGTTDGQAPYIPLFGSGTGGANGGAGNSTWFIDTARNQVVLCTAQPGGGNQAQSFTCTAQPVPNTGATPPAGGGTPPAGGGTPPADGGTPPAGGGTPPAGGGTPPTGGGTPPTGGAGSNPMGG